MKTIESILGIPFHKFEKKFFFKLNETTIECYIADRHIGTLAVSLSYDRSFQKWKEALFKRYAHLSTTVELETLCGCIQTVECRPQFITISIPIYSPLDEMPNNRVFRYTESNSPRSGLRLFRELQCEARELLHYFFLEPPSEEAID